MLVNSDGCLKKSLGILKAACSQLVLKKNSIEEAIVFLKGKEMRIRLMLLSY